MSPVVAAILHVQDPASFTTTFIAMYSGLIPMLATGANTVKDGFVGALLQDRIAPEMAEKPLDTGEKLDTRSEDRSDHEIEKGNMLSKNRGL
jgi:hypothetical protein